MSSLNNLVAIFSRLPLSG